MKVEAIPNRGPASMGPEIERGLRWANQADIATAFITPAAVNRLETALGLARKQRRQLRIRLIFGLYQRFTPPEALTRLLLLHHSYPGAFFVKVARNNRFHWKLYAFRQGRARRLYVGSANFTQDGLLAEGELSLKVSAKSRDAISKTLQNEFERAWQSENETFLLSPTFLQQYRKVKRPAVVVTQPDRDDAVSRILKRPKRLTDASPHSSQVPNPRVTYVDDSLRDETLEIVKEETNWQKRGWSYMCYWYKTDFDLDRSAQVLVIADLRGQPQQHTIKFVRITDTAKLDTPDGKYFIAFRQVPGGWCRKIETVKRDLARVGLTKKKLHQGGSLNRNQIATLCRVMHVKPSDMSKA